jgi:hypothetical protein
LNIPIRRGNLCQKYGNWKTGRGGVGKPYKSNHSPLKKLWSTSIAIAIAIKQGKRKAVSARKPPTTDDHDRGMIDDRQRRATCKLTRRNELIVVAYECVRVHQPNQPHKFHHVPTTSYPSSTSLHQTPPPSSGSGIDIGIGILRDRQEDHVHQRWSIPRPTSC